MVRYTSLISYKLGILTLTLFPPKVNQLIIYRAKIVDTEVHILYCITTCDSPVESASCKSAPKLA